MKLKLILAIALAAFIGQDFIRPLWQDSISDVAIATQGFDKQGSLCTLEDLKKLEELAKMSPIPGFVTHNHVQDDAFSVVGYWKDLWLDHSGEKVILRGTFIPVPQWRFSQDWARIVYLANHAGETFGVSIVFIGNPSSASWEPVHIISIDWVNHPAANHKGIK